MIHKYAVKLGDTTRLVELELLEGGRVRAVVDGAERTLDARQVEAGVWSLLDPSSARQALATVDGAAEKLTVALDGFILAGAVHESRSAELDALAHRTSGGGVGPALVRSPMPGRVVKVLCKPGDDVAAAQGLVIVEAMKMENEMRAPRAGKVQSVHCQEGAAVEAGQELVTLA